MSFRAAGERELLENMLDEQRTEIASVLDGLTDDEARMRLVPSLTTPLGLVKHVTVVEKVWFHARVARVTRADVGVPETVDESFVLANSDTVDEVRRTYLDVCECSRAIAARRDLAECFVWHGEDVTLRFVYTHMIAELARHAGHGDILTEQIGFRRS